MAHPVLPELTLTPAFCTIELTTAGFFKKCWPIEVFGAIRLLELEELPLGEACFVSRLYGFAVKASFRDFLCFFGLGMIRAWDSKALVLILRLERCTRGRMVWFLVS